jgi:hypothetical protein
LLITDNARNLRRARIRKLNLNITDKSAGIQPYIASVYLDIPSAIIHYGSIVIGGVWKKIVSVSTIVSGSWKTVSEMNIVISNTWKSAKE